MHPFLYSFALLLFSVSTLYSFADANERRLRGFSIDLIHPGSPILSPFYTKADGNSLRSDIKTVNFAYLMQLKVGSVSTFATMDTGSNRILLNGEGCTGSACEDHPNANFIKKPQPRGRGCYQTACETFTGLKSQVNCPRPCSYEFTFHDRFVTKGELVKDEFWFPVSGANGGKNFALWFGFSTYSDGPFEKSSAGIVGLGPDGDSSLIGQLSGKHPEIKFKFSYCLPPNPNSLGKLRFGDQVTVSGNSIELLYLPPKKQYYVRLEKISVGNHGNGQIITVSDDIVIDSGTTFTSLKPNFYTAFRDLVKKEIEGQFLVPKDRPVHKFYHDCFEHEKGRNLNAPRVLFHFSGGTTVELEKDNFFDTFDHESNHNIEWLCLTVVQGENNNILGSRAQRGFDVAIDVLQKKVSFDHDPGCGKLNA